MTKVGGVVFDITQNHSALTNFFPVAPDGLSHIASEVKQVNNGATSIKIFSSLLHTDVVVFAIRNYPNLPTDSTVGTGTGVIILTNN